MKKSIAAAALVLAAMAGPVHVMAQAPAAQPYRPAPGAKDVRATVYNWQWYMGMLRGPQERELVATLEHQATGTVMVGNQACTASAYRVSNNYQVPGSRIQYTCKLANGQERKAIEVVSGRFSWDEDVMGAEIIPGVGKATAQPALLNERLIRLWSGPQGAPKAAAMAGDKATVAWAGNKATVTYPIPGVAGAVAKATLNDMFMAERIEVRQGGTVTEFTYSDFKDWNNELNKIDAIYAGKLTEKKGGRVVRDLTTTVTETGNVYVVMPVPKSVSGG